MGSSFSPDQSQSRQLEDDSNMTDEKHESSKMEDTASSTTASFNEKALENEQSTREETRSPTPAPSVVADEAPELKKTVSAKDAQAELTKIMTSGEGVEYPTGMKLNLISLALCLSVFLMALDNTIVSYTKPRSLSTWGNSFGSGKVMPLLCFLQKVSMTCAYSNVYRSQLPSQKLRISSTHCQTLAGMDLRTY